MFRIAIIGPGSICRTYLDALRNSEKVKVCALAGRDTEKGRNLAEEDEILYYEEEFTPSFLVSLLCGIVVAGMILLVMRLSMNSKRPQRCASVYMKEGSWNLTQHRDLFLYSNVTKTRKQDPPKSSGGGSSVHRSSGGRSHGGGGGRF